MNKKTKMWLGVGVVALAGFLIWKQSQKKDKKNAMGSMKNTYSKPNVIKALSK